MTTLDGFGMEPHTASDRLSTKNIPPRDRLILALDVKTPDDAKELVDELGDCVRFYKMGLQLFMAGGYFELIEWLRERGKQVFVDLKFFDVPETSGSWAVEGSPSRPCTATTRS
jgi:orotidine-5'-phosphate decarboxylase